MKKLILLLPILLVVLVILNINLAVSEDKCDLNVSNIEALANGEYSPGGNCFFYGSLDCRASSIKVRYTW